MSRSKKSVVRYRSIAFVEKCNLPKTKRDINAVVCAFLLSSDKFSVYQH